MILKRALVFACAGAMAAGVVGCSKPETYGDRLVATGSTYRNEGERWNDAHAMSQKGAELVLEGKKELTEAEAKIAEGRSMVDKGQNIRAEIERAHSGPQTVPVQAPPQQRSYNPQ